MLTPKILEQARLCKNVYSDLEEHPGKFIKSIATDAELYVALVEDEVIVCARGSDHAKDWISNFSWDMVPFTSRSRQRSEVRVHLGFLSQYLSIKSKTLNEIDRLIELGECKKVTFIGHSAGAALCSLIAYDFAPTCSLPIELVSFGTPRVGNNSFRDSFNKDIPNCTRVVNDLDGVTLAPLISQGYCHVGKLIHIKDSKEDTEELSWFGWAFWAVKTTISYVTESVSDHFIANYVEEIEKCLEES